MHHPTKKWKRTGGKKEQRNEMITQEEKKKKTSGTNCLGENTRTLKRIK